MSFLSSFFFFFSSRRRHTRFKCDWSSDVCSSDLSTRKGIPALVRCRVAIGERLQEGHDLILLLIRQSEFAGGHIEVVLDLGPRPAVDPLDSSGGAVSGCDVIRKSGFVTRIVEMYKLLQA